jgi:hypothetical protein
MKNLEPRHQVMLGNNTRASGRSQSLIGCSGVISRFCRAETELTSDNEDDCAIGGYLSATTSLASPTTSCWQWNALGKAQRPRPC